MFQMSRHLWQSEYTFVHFLCFCFMPETQCARRRYVEFNMFGTEQVYLTSLVHCIKRALAHIQDTNFIYIGSSLLILFCVH